MFGDVGLDFTLYSSLHAILAGPNQGWVDTELFQNIIPLYHLIPLENI